MVMAKRPLPQQVKARQRAWWTKQTPAQRAAFLAEVGKHLKAVERPGWPDSRVDYPGWSV
jgi:hypothetical protein